MKSQLLLTAIGDDRPGIVARITEILVKNQGNLEESRMTILGGEFAAIMLVSVPEASIKALNDELKLLENETITVTTKPTKRLDEKRFANHSHYSIVLSGADHEGIVHQLSTFLHERAINIQSMDTDIVNAPETGAPLFRLQAIVAVPEVIDVATLKRALQELEDKESVEIEVKPLTHAEALVSLKSK